MIKSINQSIKSNIFDNTKKQNKQTDENEKITTKYMQYMYDKTMTVYDSKTRTVRQRVDRDIKAVTCSNRCPPDYTIKLNQLFARHLLRHSVAITFTLCFIVFLYFVS